MIKYIVCIIITLASTKLFSQEIIKYKSDSDSIIVNEIITKKIIDERKTNVIGLFDTSGKLILIVKDNQKYKAYKQFYKGGKAKRRNITLSKRNIKNIDKLLQNPDLLYDFSKDVCSEMVHSFTKISVIIYNGKFSYGSFYSHCKQNENADLVKELYFSLK
jgi:hypothetical protein